MPIGTLGYMYNKMLVDQSVGALVYPYVGISIQQYANTSMPQYVSKLANQKNQLINYLSNIQL
jgi:hypothetical protein